MYFILKVVLIILLNKTYAYITQDSEIILLPEWNSTGAKKISLTLKAFGNQIQLNLHRNDQIVLSAFKVLKDNAKDIMEELSQLNTSDPCYYFHDDHVNIAVVNFCQEHGLKGVVFLENTTLDITPLQNNWTSSSLIGDSCVETETNVSFGKPHLIKRSPRQVDEFHKTSSPIPQVTIKLAVFLDDTAYRNLGAIVNYNDTQIRNMLLAYVNGLQGIFHHPSLGVRIDILLTHMIIMQNNPDDFPRHDTDTQLNAFCMYANSFLDRNRSDNHWDIALQLTGIDLVEFPIEHNEDFSVKGFSFANFSCLQRSSSCALVEFSVVFNQSIIQPTAGFASVYTAAYEIAHLLGLKTNRRKYVKWYLTDGFISEESWFYEDFYPPIWSMNNSKLAQQLWHMKPCFISKPNSGSPIKFVYILMNSTQLTIDDNIYAYYDYFIQKEWTAKRQCELYMYNRDANVVTLHNVCQHLECERHNKTNYFLSTKYGKYTYKFNFTHFFTAPALEGTLCAPDKQCQNGKCIPILTVKPLLLDYSNRNDWSEWKEISCRSNCLEKSKGVITKRRICRDNYNRPTTCEGESYKRKLCDDSTICRENDKPRLPINEFIKMNCAHYNLRFPDLNLTGEGLQDAHNFDKPWLACTIYCQQALKDNYVVTYYAPRLEVITVGLDPYLPDGTWCHTKNNRNYFCLEHHCLPENET